MITKNNISDYITYLYSVRYPNQAVPNEVLSSWSRLSEHDLQKHLHQMYTAWQWDAETIKHHQNTFLQKDTVIEKTNHSLPTKLEKSGFQKYGWLISIFLIGGSFAAYQFLQEDSPNKVSNVTQNSMEVVEVTATATEIKEANPVDIQNAQKIADWISLENSQDVAEIIMMLTPNPIEYKKIPYPTEEEIFEYYYELYSTNPSYNAKVLDIKNKGNLTYQVKVQNTLSSGKQTVNYTFMFDESNKILRIKS